MLVFVYGTLLSGEYNNVYLEESTLLGEHTTEAEYTLINYGPYPASIIHGHTAVHGEVWEINAKTLEALDFLEGYPRHYNRVLINTQWGEAWMYCHTNVIPSGNWRNRHE